MATYSGNVKAERVAELVATSINKGEAISVSAAMRQVGYSPSVIKSEAGTITKKLAFQEKFDKIIDDVHAINRHATLIDTDNEQVALRAVELAYKVKGVLEDEKTQQQSFNQFFTQINISDDAVE